MNKKIGEQKRERRRRRRGDRRTRRRGIEEREEEGRGAPGRGNWWEGRFRLKGVRRGNNLWC